MLVFTLWTSVIALVTTGGIVLFGSKKRRSKTAAWLKKVRHRRWEATKAEGKRTWRAHRARRASTPRGKLRDKRRKQPRRWTGGHMRTPDDPTRARVAARKAKAGAGSLLEKAKVARANRKAGKTAKPKRILELAAETVNPLNDQKHIAKLRSSGLCGARTQAGGNCMNPNVVGGDRCHVHGGKAAA